ncbi:MAG: DUF2254 domain-containing protein [Hyphomicrobiaceae bacterium]|nr:DUF2254 domain-containing protein [Hyphomicrobiaceae bacterium]
MWRLWIKIRAYLGEQLWMRPALASLISIALAAAALYMGRLYEGPLPIELSSEALKDLLSIFASSMLAVATFSVSAVVTSVASVSNSATPRAARLILSDHTTQNVLSSFIAAFIYSIVGILALEAFPFDRVGRFIIFSGLAIIVGWVLAAFVHWIDHVTKLGRVETAVDKISHAASVALIPTNVGSWGAHIYAGSPPAAAAVVAAGEVGYVTSLNVRGLQELATDLDVAIYMTVRPGDFVDTMSPIAYLTPVSAAVRQRVEDVQKHVAVDVSRAHDQDIRFGLVSLAETADRALSSAINDPGTAIVILGRQLGLITKWVEVLRSEETREILYGSIYIPPLTAAEIVRESFTPIARDGAGAVEVGIKLQKTLAALIRLDEQELTEAAVEMSDIALQLSNHALISDVHKARIEEVAKEVNRLANARSDAERNLAANDGVNF